MIYLDKDFEKHWAGKDPFKEADRLEGEVFRLVKNRRTLRFQIASKSYFIKIHHGVGYREIFKNLLIFKKPIVSAANEYNAILSLEKLGVDTMKVAAYGEKGTNPAKIESFIITEDLSETISLEDYCMDWKNNPPKFALKKAIVEYIANVSRILHENGINHRDYYICHFLLDISEGIENVTPDKIKAYLIDLHRAQIRSKTPIRWLVKDIGGIWFSAMDAGLTRSDRLRFMKIYSGKSPREFTDNDRKFWSRVQSRAERIYAKESGK